MPPLPRLTRSGLIGLLAIVLAPCAFASNRLGHDVAPIDESVSLTLDPRQPDYRGTVEATLRVPAPIDSFRLHASGLTLDSLVLRRDGRRVPVTWRPGSDGLLLVRSAQPLVPGEHTLTIGFHGAFDTQALGLYRVKVGEDWYAFTQFEAVEARRAFPCWDEPDFKIPWRITLRTPRGQWVAANTPEAVARDDDAWRVTRFVPTPPMPSYLVAFTVGPFDTLSVAGLPGPGRILSPRGTRALAAEAAAQAGPLLASLERWFGRRYPYPKLDLVAAPEFAYGAMENAGLIVFLDQVLLQDRRTMSPAERRHMADDIAHEMAHQWFGDLVTMRWWDDLWLNESFAEWMQAHAVDDVFPAMAASTRQLEGRARAFQTDAQPGVRAMRRPIGDSVDLDQLADALAYNKGQALLCMFEQWLGPERCRDGVREYLRRFAWGNAVGPELWATLSTSSGLDVAGPMASFLDQPGVPEVVVEQAGGGSITLSQHRFFERAGVDSAASTWRIPVVLALWDGHAIHHQRVLLDRPRERFALDVADPVWVHPNADEAGYYRWRVPAPMLERIAAAGPTALTTRERLALPGAAFAALAAGEQDGATTVHLIERAARDPDAMVVRAALEASERLRATFIDDPTAAPYAGWLARTFAPALAGLGPNPRTNEPEAATDLRAALMWQLGAFAGDTTLTARAGRESARWLADPASVDGSLASTWLRLAARTGDLARFEAYRRRFESGLASDLRQILFDAFGQFRAPETRARAIAYALDGPLRPQEVLRIAQGWSETPALRAEARVWVRGHYDAIEARIPRSRRDALLRIGEGVGDEGLAETRAFFSDPARVTPAYREELIHLVDRQTGSGALRARAGDEVRRAMGAAPLP